VLTLIGIPAVMAVVGWTAATMINNPDDVRRAEPTPSLITEEVVSTVLESAVVGRGDVVESERVTVTLTGEVGLGPDQSGQSVYTGRLARAGDEVAEGNVLAEISGRPVFVLQGEIPMYRALAPGTEGTDVEQLELALERLGHFDGAPDERYDAATEAAVERLYAELGYAPIDSGTGTIGGELDMAEAAVTEAEAALAEAEAAREIASTGPTEGEVLSAEAAVLTAERELANAEATGDEVAVAQAEAALALTREQVAALASGPDLSEVDEAVDAAQENLDKAVEAFDQIASASGITVPRGEVVVVPQLPRRVGTASVEIGQAPGGEAFTLVGAETEVAVQMSREEAELIEVGQAAELFEQSWGIDATGTVASVDDAADEGGLLTVRVVPDQDIGDAVGANIRVRIPIGSTGGEVLAVSVASVYTDADGRTYVDRVSEAASGGGAVEPIEVTLGLVSESLVEITPVGNGLSAGDRVAVAGQ
jgi:hypothetical protein